MERVTRDHSLVEILLEQGMITGRRSQGASAEKHDYTGGRH